MKAGHWNRVSRKSQKLALSRVSSATGVLIPCQQQPCGGKGRAPRRRRPLRETIDNCGRRAPSGGVTMSGPITEGREQRCPVGELQKNFRKLLGSFVYLCIFSCDSWKLLIIILCNPRS